MEGDTFTEDKNTHHMTGSLQTTGMLIPGQEVYG